MAEREEIKIVYTCPKCGRQAVFGEHFCAGRRAFDWRRLWSVVAVVLIFALLFALTRNPLLSLVAVPVLFGLYWLLFRSGKADPRRELLRLARGDEALAQRLIEAERRRQPGRDDDYYAECAYRRLLADRQR